MVSMREKQKVEAATRLKLMGVREDICRRFEEEGIIMFCNDGRYSHCSGKLEVEIRKFEQKHDATVFLAVRMPTTLGTLDALLFVDKYEDEWLMAHAGIKNGYAMSYVINRTYPECSEMGGIAFRTTKSGGIIREG